MPKLPLAYVALTHPRGCPVPARAPASCVEWELLFLLLFKRLAKDVFVGRARPLLMWPHLMPIIFSRTLLLLNLPGGAGQVTPKGNGFTNAAANLVPSQWPAPMATLRAAARLRELRR